MFKEAGKYACGPWANRETEAGHRQPFGATFADVVGLSNAWLVVARAGLPDVHSVIGAACDYSEFVAYWEQDGRWAIEYPTFHANILHIGSWLQSTVKYHDGAHFAYPDRQVVNFANTFDIYSFHSGGLVAQSSPPATVQSSWSASRSTLPPPPPCFPATAVTPP